MTKKKHEELVEEFREAFERFHDVCMDIQLGQDDQDVYIEQRTEHLITLVLSAVRDGRLDEELGVSKEEIEKELAFALGKEEEKNGDGSGRPD